MELYVTLILWGDCLIPEEITEMVAIPPIKSNRKGDQGDRHGAMLQTYRTGMWSVSTEGFIGSDSLADHLRFIADKFCDKLPLLKKDNKVDKARLSIMVVIENEEATLSSWEDEIDAETLNKVNQLGASLSLVVMYPVRT